MIENQLVRRAEGGYYEFLDEGVNVYDVRLSNEMEALQWVRHLSKKTWITKRHIEQFADLVCADLRHKDYA